MKIAKNEILSLIHLSDKVGHPVQIVNAGSWLVVKANTKEVILRAPDKQELMEMIIYHNNNS